MMDEPGFVLVNDYSMAVAGEASAPLGLQRFGRTVAMGLDFQSLGRLLSRRGFVVTGPRGDEARGIHTRLIARNPSTRLMDTLESCFGLEAHQHQQEPIDQARTHASAGQKNEALDTYRLALERNSGDWQLLGEIAEYVGLQLRDFASGAALARAALERNAWYSPWLWNVLGDCLFCEEKQAAAHEAYLEAQRIDPSDPRTSLNLAYTYGTRGQYAEALQALARGLARDVHGIYRKRLLDKQGEILATQSTGASLAMDHALKRLERFR